MFLLKRFIKIILRRLRIFTIQNVPIKVMLVICNLGFSHIFTIQNVPINLNIGKVAYTKVHIYNTKCSY